MGGLGFRTEADPDKSGLTSALWILHTLRAHLVGIGSGASMVDRLAIAAGLGRRCVDRMTVALRDRGVPAIARRGHPFRIRNSAGDFTWIVPPEGGAGWLFAATLGPPILAAFSEVHAGTVIDVGASFGYYTVHWAKQVDGAGRVLAIEPYPPRYAALCQNIVTNGVMNVTPVAEAAGDRIGSVTLYVPPEGSRHDVTMVEPTGTPFTVAMRPLDAIVADIGGPPVTAVKLDVEGAEPQVLDGMASILHRDRPLVLFEAANTSALAMCSIRLRAAGYTVAALGAGDYLARPGDHRRTTT